MSEPLAGKTIVVTRARHQASRLSQELETLGARVMEIPAIEIAPPNSYAPLDEALGRMQEYQWLIVTSVNTVRVLKERLDVLGQGIDMFSSVRCAAIGSATQSALAQAGVHVEVIPSEYVAESLVVSLRDRVARKRVLLVRAAIARDVLPDELRKWGAMVDVVDAYRTVIPEESTGRIREAFAATGDLPDAVTFTSSSTVTNFFQLLRAAGIQKIPTKVRALSIGPVTSAALREHGWEPAVEADPHDVTGLVRAAILALG